MKITIERKMGIVLSVSLSIFVGMVLGSAAWLPGRVAVHFNFVGEPDAWASRKQAIFFMVLLGVGLTVLIPGLVYFSRFFSDSIVNLPNKSYWLAPERRNETFTRLFRSTAYLTTLLLGFMAAIHVLIVLANKSPTPHLTAKTVILPLVGFLLVTGIWLFRLVRAFDHAPTQA